jgi:hypothetical protein
MMPKPVASGLERSENSAADNRNDCLLRGAPVDREDVIAETYLAFRRKHPDFDAMQSTMLLVSRALTPNWSRIDLAEYLEALYIVAKTADFVAPVRNQLLLSEAAVPEHRM